MFRENEGKGSISNREKNDPNANRITKTIEHKQPTQFHDETKNYLLQMRNKRNSAAPQLSTADPVQTKSVAIEGSNHKRNRSSVDESLEFKIKK